MIMEFLNKGRLQISSQLLKMESIKENNFNLTIEIHELSTK